MIKKYIRISLVSPKKILNWTERSLPNGELVGKLIKAETIDYKSLKPINNGLFCEKIFGPIKSYECPCKLYKKIRVKKEKNKIVICPNCYVQITDSRIRRYRMGYIKLSTEIVHTWFFKENPNYICLVLNKKKKYINNILSGKLYIVTKNKNLITGGSAVYLLLKRLKLNKLTKYKSNNIKDKKVVNRMKIINYFIQSKLKPEWMTLKFLPVLPPELRPIIKLQDNTVISSDLNSLYKNIITINNRVNQLKIMQVSEKFIKAEKWKLQLSIDNLLNEKKGKNSTNANKKSLTKILKGKSGRIRENLLGKTVDYSARSVIGVEPKLKVSECGIPTEIAKQLFQSLLIKKILQLKINNNIRQAKEILEKKKQITNSLLNRTLKNYNILLNRAPTLHRISIQSFKTIITKDKIIKLHPLVCSAFNADFDGDQMGIHIPLSLKSQAEAKTIMLSSNNSTVPSTGKPNMVMSQDMILGCYFLTIENSSIYYLLNKIKYFKDETQCLKAYKKKTIDIHYPLWIISKKKQKRKDKVKLSENKRKKIHYIRLTIGRLIFSITVDKFL